jgi:cytochrome c oxidase assembly protein subunit 11
MSLSAIARARTLVADNRRMVGKLVVVTILMFGFGYALVPIYRTICEALGINVLARAEVQSGEAVGATLNSQVDLGRIVTIEFDANARGPWDFKPAQAKVDVHPGEVTTVMYEFRNRQNRTMVAQAFPSYAPNVAMAHFKKLECFCFTEHVLKPGESKQWPVVFVVDRKLPKDVRTITLSYTFFEVGGKTPVEPSALAAPVLPAKVAS